MTVKRISVGDFSTAPFGRYADDGTANGERFRKEVLLPAFMDKQITKIVVELDTVEDGYEYGSSFLEESFGGLVKKEGLSPEYVIERLEIVTIYNDYKSEIIDYIRNPH